MEDVKSAYISGDHEQLNAKFGTKLVKPDIVFYGESLPERCFHLSDDGSLLISNDD